jgi:hypothetical protein
MKYYILVTSIVSIVIYSSLYIIFDVLDNNDLPASLITAIITSLSVLILMAFYLALHATAQVLGAFNEVPNLDSKTVKTVKTVDRMFNIYKIHDRVQHIKTRRIYEIVEIPVPYSKLEYCNDSFYTYSIITALPIDKELIHWIRSKTEMEDGRFKKLD